MTAPPEVRCGRVHRHEQHAPHTWKFQAEDDSPALIEALCPGFTVPDIAPSREQVVEACGELYRPEGVEIWMGSPNPMFNLRTPDEMVAAGEGERVLDLIEALCEGVIF